MAKRVVWQGDAYSPVAIGQRIGRLIPRPIGQVLLRLARRYAPGIYAEAIGRALNDGPGSPQWAKECEEFGCHEQESDQR